jgi:hypothetical protein
MDLIIKLLVGVGIVVVAWMLLAPRRDFVIRIENGRARLVSGKAPPGLVQDVGEVCRDAGVNSGSVWGRRSGKRVGLGFSGDIPEGCRQRLRNLTNL